jgi:uncharacterized Zn-binding protein involved in type VI secretion
VTLDAHGCPACPHPAIGPAIQGSPDVNINKRPALRVDDPGIHTACCGTNTWTATHGSQTVFINGKGAHRMGDQNRHCGGMGQLVEGSPNVIVGETGGQGGSSAGGGGASSAGGGSGSSAGGGSGSSAGGGGNNASAGSAGGGGGAGANPGSGAAPANMPDTPVEPDEIEIRVIDAHRAQVGGIAYELTMPDGSVRTGNAGPDGVIKLTRLTQRGDCKIVFRSVDDQKKGAA